MPSNARLVAASERPLLPIAKGSKNALKRRSRRATLGAGELAAAHPRTYSSSNVGPVLLESSLLIGVDLVRVTDVARSIDRFGDRYTRRLFTVQEIGYCNAEPRLAGERFAARFAAKEATTKVLRIESDALLWKSIEVRRSPEGWCDIVLHDEVAALARKNGISGFAVSMSHEQEYAIATVVAHRTVAASS